jgi:PEP-CTERM motif-containing protein
MRPANTRCRRISLVFVVLVPGFAQALTILQTSRTLSITETYNDPLCNCAHPVGQSVSDPGSGPWAASLSGTQPYQGVSASQSSLISETVLNASASVATRWLYDSANTQYHVVFALDAATAYEFAVDNVDSSFPSRSPGEPGGVVALDQVDPGNFATVLRHIYSIYLGRNSMSGEGFANFADASALASGTYALDFRLGKSASHLTSAPGSAGFSLIVVPEPGTASLALLGAFVLAFQRRRRATPARVWWGERQNRS